MKGALKVDLALICDDVRREDNGKLIIIGVYNRNIQVPKLPATLILSSVVRLVATEATDIDVEFQYLMAGEPKASTKGHLKVTEAGPSLLNLPPLPIVDIRSECDLEFQWRFGPDDTWETIYSIPVVTSKKKSSAST